ncbi:MAG: YggS family pyridoxal phosphate-dependent enzyme [Candidatus Hydrothermia bacterium]
MTKEEIQSNIERIFETVNEVCQKAGISRQITIEAITKGVDMERILWAYECGINVMGENRVQEALLKIPFLNLDIEWHLVGHLQTNKVKHAVKIFRVIESVDRIELVGAVNKHLETPMEVFVEVNTSGEQQKAGCKIEEVHPLIEEILMREKLILTGLMTVGPYPVEEKRTRESFAKLYKTKEVIEKDFGINLKWLSMGMTEDYPYAILEGANLLRIGRGIFGGRL